jgi:hypothetical protein
MVCVPRRDQPRRPEIVAGASGTAGSDKSPQETNRLDEEVMRDKREKRDLHALNEDGMVLCNPRDREAAHRAQMEGIATEDEKAVTCRKCLALLHQRARDRRSNAGEAR